MFNTSAAQKRSYYNTYVYIYRVIEISYNKDNRNNEHVCNVPAVFFYDTQF